MQNVKYNFLITSSSLHIFLYKCTQIRIKYLILSISDAFENTVIKKFIFISFTNQNIVLDTYFMQNANHIALIMSSDFTYFFIAANNNVFLNFNNI